MSNINAVLESRSFEVKQLLRRNRIIGPPNIDSIKRGFDKAGVPFMMKLLAIITPTESSFTDLIQPRQAILTAAPINTQKLTISSVPEPVEGKAKIWTFWDNLLNGINKTGETVNKFKTDISGTATDQAPTPEAAAAAAAKSKTLYLVAAGIVILIILILIFKK